MRPIRLKMTGFGPYVKTVDLNFENGLGGENFFLIHGLTGSGKTMILDAICFALYGESSGGGRKSSMFRSELAAPNEKTTVEFIFSLRDKVYRIVRNPKYQRASLRGDGLTEEKASAEIFEGDAKIPVRDVSDYVKNLLKFDCDQFRQVVILPQGSFQKFLKSKSNERQEVLDTLFDAEFFRRVEDELKNKSTDAQKIFEQLDGNRKKYLEDAKNESGDENFDAGKFPALTKKFADELEAVTTQIQWLDAQFNAAQKNLTEGEKIAALFKDLDKKSQALSDAEKVLEKILFELAAAKAELEKRNAEETQRENLKLLLAKLEEKKTALKNFAAKQAELKAAITNSEKSAAEVERLMKYKKSCDVTMAQLQSDVERLQDAPAKKVSAKKIWDDAIAREKLLREIEDLREQISTAEKSVADARKKSDDAEKFLSELRERQISGSATRLAETLIDGTPCPVCGAIHHPKPAKSDATIPTDAQIKAAETKAKTEDDKKNSAEKNLASLKDRLADREKTLSEGEKVPTVAEAKAEFDKISADLENLYKARNRIKDGEEKTRKAEEDLANAQNADRKFSGEEKILRGAVESMKSNIEEKYLSNPRLIDEEISSAKKDLDKLNAAFKNAQDNFNRLNERAAAQKSTVDADKKNLDEISAKVEGKILPDVDALTKISDDARTNHIKAVESRTNLNSKLKRLKELEQKISALADDLNSAEKNLLMWKTLSDAASGKITKISFRRYYLATMFKEVVDEANNRLEKMSSGRYRFQIQREVTDRRIAGGLDLEIVDEYTGSARSVETLSGGESFLASLSLALGLAAVVQNNSGGIKLDTIFIDEGFGTLDSETLEIAMKALIELQRGGRLVGIISHVEELKNQIPVRLEVTKTKNGSTAKFIS
ncbi:MAG: SMC family ATPase [Selenomonadaceae bacterium]|nr:SMC family ATPase [Selenomonadaceae bacterium]